jgi:hypothetical protein
MELAHEGRIQILLSIWAINEAIAAIDRKYNQRREITLKDRNAAIVDILQQGIDWSDPKYNVYFVPLDKIILEKSVPLVMELHISADDAIQVYTSYVMHCEAFVCSDAHIKKQVDYKIEDMRILDITNSHETNKLFRCIEQERPYF